MADWRWTRLAILAAATAAAMPWPLPAQAQAPDAQLQEAQRDLREQAEMLNRPANGTPQQMRDESAARLVARQTPEADRILLEALQRFVNPDGQLAVARALAGDASPDPAFIRPLANTLGVTRVSEAAARALVHVYKTTRDEVARALLQEFALNRGQVPRFRGGAIVAMGRLVDKPTAEFLIGRLRDATENSLVQDAAVDALREITGEDFGRDIQRWLLWWGANQNLPEIDWVSARLARNAALRDIAERNLAQLSEFADRVLRDSYARAGAEEKPNIILSALRSESEDARLLGIGVLFAEVAQGQTGVYQKLAETLAGMVGDSSPLVRRRVAETMDSAGDQALVPAILAQLPIETDKDVLQAMMKALSARADVRAVEPLLAKLDDPSYVIAEAAAVALTDRMAERLRLPENKDVAERVASRLRRRLESIRGDRAADDLRFRIVEAMSDLAHPSLLRDLTQLASDGAIRVRQRAYFGLGRIGNPETVNIVAQGLRDPADAVRLRAVEALEGVGTFEISQAVANLLSANAEPNETVRTRAWQVLQSLFRKAPDGRALEVYADRFKRQQDHDRREKVLAIMEEKFEAAGNAERLAFARTNRGEELLALARLEKLPGAQIDLALKAQQKLAEALEYYRGQNAKEATTSPLMQQRLEALLLAKRFDEAMAFALEEVTRNRGFMDFVMTISGNEIKRLEMNRELKPALDLIDALKKLPIDAVSTQQLDRSRERIQKTRDSGGHVWSAPYFAFTPLGHVWPSMSGFPCAGPVS